MKRERGVDGIAFTHGFQIPLLESNVPIAAAVSYKLAFFLLLYAGPPSKCMHAIHVSCEDSAK